MKIAFSTITCFFLSILVNAQLHQTSQFHRKTGWLCNETIILDSTGLFFNDWGCENELRVAYGKYSIKKAGVLQLRYLSLASLPPVAYMKQTVFRNDSLVEIRL